MRQPLMRWLQIATTLTRLSQIARPPQEATLCQYDIEKLIVTVRDEQVLIYQDIARIYGVTTGRLNE